MSTHRIVIEAGQSAPIAPACEGGWRCGCPPGHATASERVTLTIHGKTTVRLLCGRCAGTAACFAGREGITCARRPL
jgi:hypothetical protein